MTQARFSFPTPIIFGAGVRHQVAEHFKGQNITSVLIVTDEMLSKLPFFVEYAESLKKAGLKIEVFNGVKGNPVKSQVMAGVDAFRKSGAAAILGIGGGAVSALERKLMRAGDGAPVQLPVT